MRKVAAIPFEKHIADILIKNIDHFAKKITSMGFAALIAVLPLTPKNKLILLRLALIMSYKSRMLDSRRNPNTMYKYGLTFASTLGTLNALNDLYKNPQSAAPLFRLGMNLSYFASGLAFDFKSPSWGKRLTESGRCFELANWAAGSSGSTLSEKRCVEFLDILAKILPLPFISADNASFHTQAFLLYCDTAGVDRLSNTIINV